MSKKDAEMIRAYAERTATETLRSDLAKQHTVLDLVDECTEPCADLLEYRGRMQLHTKIVTQELVTRSNR